ncbi:MAG TPA: methyltransferase domain-containing protein [Solirubrobacteraceae bacterium]|nr:methyltransferase domain-containing protein [Solirubrobacteraceae bacterium]
MPDTPRDWDGATYDRISGPQQGWGREVLERLPLRGEETVLDAGCGSGRVTEMLAERLPRGHVVAVDASPSMVAAARERLGGRVDVRLMDLQELELEQPLDAIFSTATFHWIPDHERLFGRLHTALRPGGRLVAQCGGEGNVARTRAAAEEVSARGPFEPYMRGWPGPWNFSSAELAQQRLLAAGFQEARCWLYDVTVHPPEPREFLRSVNLGSHLRRLPEELREPFVDAVYEVVGEPYRIHYVRLNIDAVA